MHNGGGGIETIWMQKIIKRKPTKFTKKLQISCWKKVKIDNKKLTAIQEHLLRCNYSPTFEDFSILTRESNDFKLKIMESLLIARDKPILNNADSPLPVELFQYNISGCYVLSHHMMSIFPIVHIQLPFVQFSLLCYKFCISSNTERKSIYYHFTHDHKSSGFRKLARNKWICWEICNFFVIKTHKDFEL